MKKLISFLSIFILSAALSGPALASSAIMPGTTVSAGVSEAQRVHRHGKGRFDEKHAKAFVDGLVADNVIPRETGDKLLAYFSQKREAHKAERDKLRSMTEEERKAYFEERKAEREADGPFAELVKNGTLTKAQAEAVAKALREYKKK